MPKLGLTVTINGDDVYNICNADLIDYEVVPSTITKDTYKYLGKHNYRLNSFTLGDSSLQLRFYVGGITEQLAQININTLLSYFINKVPVVTISDTEFEYVCVLSSVESANTTVDYYYEVKLTIDAIKRLPLVNVERDNPIGGYNIVYNGDIPSGLNVIFQTINNQSSVSFNVKDPSGNINSYTFRGIANYSIINLDGINGKIYVATSLNNLESGNVVNWFLKTDIIDFPKLYYGKNSITITSGVNNKISKIIWQYYPLFMV